MLTKGHGAAEGEEAKTVDDCRKEGQKEAINGDHSSWLNVPQMKEGERTIECDEGEGIVHLNEIIKVHLEKKGEL